MSHLQPFFCPYCGEEDIAPHGDDAGGWRCGSCLRAFLLRSARAAAGTTGSTLPDPALSGPAYSGPAYSGPAPTDQEEVTA